MKILQLCNRVPWPPNDGGAIAVFNMIRSLHNLGNEVTVLSLNTSKHHINKESLPPIFSGLKGFEMVDINTDITPFSALKNLFSSKAFHISRFWSDAFARKLEEILSKEQFDIIQIENLPTTLYVDGIRKLTKASIVYRAHNIEYIIWQRMAESLSFGMKKWYLKLQANRLKKYEQSAWHNMDAIIPITEVDAHFLIGQCYKKPLYSCPVGINVSDYIPSIEVNNSCIFHLGALNWQPNVEGVLWFINEVLPLVLKEIPTIKFHLAGRDMPENISNMKREGLIIDGEVPDSKTYTKAAGIMIVPLLAGSGMRVKIIEGMALGKPIVSTSIGAEGIRYSDGKDILIADAPNDFAHAIVKLASDKNLASTLATNARKLVEAQYDNEKIVEGLINFYHTL